ncbi:MAG: PmoA family protein [Balneolaceae bacterium]
MKRLYKNLLSISAAVLFLVCLNDLTNAQSYQVTVSAGDIDRSESIVSFYFPDETEQGIYQMTGDSGESVTLQVEENNRGWFILDELAAGSSRTYQVEKAAESGSVVTTSFDSSTVTFKADGRDVISYYHGENSPPDELDDRYKRGGYIHPVKSPAGVVLTAHLNPQHPHHSGIWSAWTNTEFEGHTPDFWNVHLNTGRVDLADSLEAAWEGPVHGGFRTKHHFINLSGSEPEIALNEEWNVKIYPSAGGGNLHVFDLKVTQTVNTGKPLFLPQYRYGGVGFRGHKDWDDPENGTFLTSEGLGRDGHGTRVRWTHIGGHSNGELAGIAILSHPSNFRHPQTVRIHPDEPFFNYAPAQLGDMSIEPGSPYVVRYRYITYDGEPDPELIDRLWWDYAYPPSVTVKQ